MAARPSNWTDLSCERIKLVGERPHIGAAACKLALADHMHKLYAGEHAAGRAERFKVEHRLGHTLDGVVVLFDDVVEVFDVTYHDRHVTSGVDGINSRLVGAALVHRDLLGLAIHLHSGSMPFCVELDDRCDKC